MKSIRIVWVVILLMMPTTLRGDGVNHGSVLGTNVDFNNIFTISNTFDGPIYGDPTGLDNAISFVPFGFQASSDGAPTFQEGRLSVELDARDGFLLDYVEVLEVSSFLLFGEDATVVSNTTGVANVGNNLLTEQTANQMRGDFFNGTGNTLETGFIIDLGGVDQASFVLDSQVLATAVTSGNFASISKTGLVIRVNTTAIPEPGSLAVVTLLLGVCGLRRRR